MRPRRIPMTDLTSLIRDLEAAKEGSRELDIQIDRLVRPHEYVPTTLRPGDLSPPPGFGCDALSLDLHSAPLYTRSVDAALTLVPARGDDGLLWRIFLEQKPLHSGPSWIAIVREHAKDGGDAIGYTAPLAICTAALKARSASRDAR